MLYCKRCFYPETKPDLRFNSNCICGACEVFDNRPDRDWNLLEDQFINYIKENKTHKHFDCIIPVSGGKDSTYQVLKILEYGFNPLCVTAPTDYMTEIGKRNLQNIIKIGVDHISITVNPEVRKKINRHSFFSVGDLQWPEHLLINTIPLHIAKNFGISIVIRGECPIREYGAGRIEDENLNYYSRRILEEYGGLNGQRVSDLCKVLNISSEKLSFYEYPDLENSEIKVKPLWLDYYFPWSGLRNTFLAMANGFNVSEENILGTISNSENLDNYIHGIHDYFKYLKYGFSRTTDYANNLLRRKIITRKEAATLINKNDGLFPSYYLDKTLEEILSFFDITIEEFNSTADDYTNYDLFKCNEDGSLILREDGSPELKQSVLDCI